MTIHFDNAPVRNTLPKSQINAMIIDLYSEAQSIESFLDTSMALLKSQRFPNLTNYVTTIQRLALLVQASNEQVPDLKNNKNLDLLIRQIKIHIRDMTPRNFSDIIWSWAILDLPTDDNVFQLIIQTANIEDLTLIDAAKISYGCAKLQLKNNDILDRVASRVIALRPVDFEDAEILDFHLITWAYSTLDLYDHRLFTALAGAISNHLENQKNAEPHHVALIARSYAYFDHYDTQLLDEIARYFMSVTAQSIAGGPDSLRNLATVARAFADLNYTHRRLLQTINNAICQHESLIRPCDITNFMKAFATLAIQMSNSCIEKLIDIMFVTLNQFSASELSAIAFSLARQNLRRTDVLQAIIKKFLENQVDCISSLSQLAWACSEMEMCDDTFVMGVFDKTSKKIHLLTHSRFVLLIEAYMNFGEKNAISYFLSKINKFDIQKFSRKELLAIHKANLFIEGKLPPSIQNEINERGSSGSPRSSGTHLEIARLAQRCFKSFNFKNEVLIDGYFVDMADEKRKIIIEYDGPFHYFQGTRELTGSEKSKNRILQRSWTLIRIPYWEWDELRDNSTRIEYLTRVLKPMPASK